MEQLIKSVEKSIEHTRDKSRRSKHNEPRQTQLNDAVNHGILTNGNWVENALPKSWNELVDRAFPLKKCVCVVF